MRFLYRLISDCQIYDRISTHPDDEVAAHVLSQVCDHYDVGQNQQNYICAQRRLRSAWASAQSDQSLRCPHEETLDSWLHIGRIVMTDQTGRSLRWWHWTFVGFVMLWLIYKTFLKHVLLPKSFFLVKTIKRQQKVYFFSHYCYSK